VRTPIDATPGRYKRSRQRERLLEVLAATRAHPTAAWLYDELRKEFPDLSMGTVYRNLSILVEQDLVRKIDFGSTFDRFEVKTAPHYHFICDRCGSVSDLPLPLDEELNGRVLAETGFHALRHRIEFYGVCRRCAE
jgi:Fur family peroxide stress response transcriptional regulator